MTDKDHLNWINFNLIMSILLHLIIKMENNLLNCSFAHVVQKIISHHKLFYFGLVIILFWNSSAFNNSQLSLGLILNGRSMLQLLLCMRNYL